MRRASSVWTQTQIAPCGAAERVGRGPLRRNAADNAPVPSLDQLIAKYKPNLIVIGGGDTMAGYAQAQFPAPWVELQVNALIQPIAAAKIACVWVGPGWGTEGGPFFKSYAGVRQINSFLSTHVAPCRYIDSTSFAQPGEWPTFDGQHYTLPGYAKWGHAIERGDRHPGAKPLSRTRAPTRILASGACG